MELMEYFSYYDGSIEYQSNWTFSINKSILHTIRVCLTAWPGMSEHNRADVKLLEKWKVIFAFACGRHGYYTNCRTYTNVMLPTQKVSHFIQE